jgi:anti-sigma factor (TIGR02949 family)
MTSPHVEAQLDAYLDGELTAMDRREIEAHLAECAECERFRDARLALRAAIREQLPAWRAPDTLRARVNQVLRSEAGLRAPRRGVVWRALAVAASLAVVALGSWRLALHRAAGQQLADQLLASHVRSLMPGHLTDVLSSDQHTVKPWFNGRLDFSPSVYDYSGRGFPLIGGRLDYAGGRSVAALVYQRRQHLINVYVWPAAQGPSGGPSTAARQGYHLLHWDTPQYVYWVVSDLGLAELRDFVALLQTGDSVAAPRRL